ncbi:MAG: TIGR04086 family membrane protein, partial [Clostridia bacterium]|nr:TIGR04086 family membrane protein [Clostridia bacterium]
VVALAAGAALAAALAAVVAYTSLSESYVPLVLHYAGLLVMACGGLVAGRRADALGWLHGGLAAVLAAAVAVLLAPAGGAVALSWPGVLLAFLAGSLGGVIGVNL